MALVDLKSDLSKYRSVVSNDSEVTEIDSKAKYANNFATYQPISDTLIKNLPKLEIPQKTDVTRLLNSTKLDDISKPKTRVDLASLLKETTQDDFVKKSFESMLVNSISEFSPKNIDIGLDSISRLSTEDIQSNFAEIKNFPFVSKLNKSNILVVKSDAGKNNNSSDIEIQRTLLEVDRTETSPDINKNKYTFETKLSSEIDLNKEEFSEKIVNPNILVEDTNISGNIVDPQIETFDSRLTGNIIDPKTIIQKSVITGNVTVPNIKIQKSLLESNKESVIIDKSLVSPINNIINPGISLEKKPLSIDRTQQSLELNDDIKLSGNITIPDIVVDKNNITLLEEKFDLKSEYNVALFDNSSKLEYFNIVQPANTNYNFEVNHEEDNSKFNIDRIVKTIPSGRNDGDKKSQFAPKDKSGVDFIPNDHATGFIINKKTFQSDFTEKLSQYTFDTPNSVDYFDLKKQNTKNGFKLNVNTYESDYLENSSIFDWDGMSEDAPSVNYFDLINQYTEDGFKTFTIWRDTDFIEDSSIFSWIGNREDSPAVNYFDISNRYSINGFKTLINSGETDYIPEASIFDWDGLRNSAPSVNYFDISNQYTTSGFTTFAPWRQTEFITDSSIFDWDGLRNAAPSVDYFDLTNQYTAAGFRTFTPFRQTEYIPDASTYDWDGVRGAAPAVNYFDIPNQYTTAGFTTFAIFRQTEYIPDASTYDWDGVRGAAPAVNYFDIPNQYTVAGFRTFAPWRQTEYVPEASIFDWDGLRNAAPAVDYFDISKQYTTAGFTTFAPWRQTEYVPESSIFDWDGLRNSAPAVNYFDIGSKYTWRGFHILADTAAQDPQEIAAGWPLQAGGSSYKFIGAGNILYLDPLSSIFDWDGLRNSAPSVNYFDIASTHTWRGFHTFADVAFQDSQEIAAGWPLRGGASSYKFASSGNALYLDPLASVYDWDGVRGAAPAVNYFDTGFVHTWRGFHIFADVAAQDPIEIGAGWPLWYGASSYKFAGSGNALYLEPLASIYDWDGIRGAAPAVNYFDIASTHTWRGFHTFADVAAQDPIEIGAGWPLRAGASSYKFAGSGNALYLEPLASIYDWDGVRGAAPAVNYFDIGSKYTWRGFHTFADVAAQDPIEIGAGWPLWYGASSYKFAGSGNTLYLEPLASIYDWDGVRGAAPAVNYFDTGFIHTWRGFHILADTAPQDPQEIAAGWPLRGGASSYKFASSGNTLYLDPLASVYDWDGVRGAAPSVNYFDTGFVHTWRGFHIFADVAPQDSIEISAGWPLWYGASSYKFSSAGTILYLEPLASIYDWDGVRGAAPAVNYFDIASTHTWRGFHTFADVAAQDPIEIGAGWPLRGGASSYKFAGSGNALYLEPLASIYDWDGVRGAAPAVNYFDTSLTHTWRGFHTFADVAAQDPQEILAGWPLRAGASSYRFDSAGNILYLEPLASIYDWDGVRGAAPAVNYFDTALTHTWRGFHTFADVAPQDPQETLAGWPLRAGASSYKFSSSGNILYLEPLASIYDWDGIRGAAPSVNYFDTALRHTWRGFHNFADVAPQDPSEISAGWPLNAGSTSYKITGAGRLISLAPGATRFGWYGYRADAPSVNYFDTALRHTWRGFHKYANVAPQHPNEIALGWPLHYGSTSYKISGGITYPAIHLDPNSTIFDWDGPRLSAIASNYFNSRRYVWRGFHTFADIAQQSQEEINIGWSLLNGSTSFRLEQRGASLILDPNASNLDWDGLWNDSFGTQFFRFIPNESAGFIKKMTRFDGTAYPIIIPRFDYDYADRPAIELLRSQFGMSTDESLGVIYAPNVFGQIPWANGFTSTFFNQVPNIRIEYLDYTVPLPAPSNSIRKYFPRGSSNGPSHKFEDWINIQNQVPGFVRQSSSGDKPTTHLEYQYKKYNLKDEAYQTDIIWNQPFVDTSIGGPDGNLIGNSTRLDEGLVRGGIVTQVNRTLLDIKRIGKWLTSGKGLIWNVKQIGLQLMNPNLDLNDEEASVFGISLPTTVLGLLPSQTYNPLSVIANVTLRSAGAHIPRHGLLGIVGQGLNKYGEGTIRRELKQRFIDPAYSAWEYLETPDSIGSRPEYNRLIGLMKELLPASFLPTDVYPAGGSANDYRNIITRTYLDLNNAANKPEIYRISRNFGGGNSFLGIGGTIINRARHPYLTYYTTSPQLSESLTLNPAYLPTAQRTTYYAGAKGVAGVPEPVDYRSFTKSDYVETSNKIFGLIHQLYALLRGSSDLGWEDSNKVSPRIQNKTRKRIKILESFNPKYESLESRMTAADENNSARSLNGFHEGLSSLRKPSNIPSVEAATGYRVSNYDGLKRYDATPPADAIERLRAYRFDYNVHRDSFTHNDFRWDIGEQARGTDFSTNSPVRFMTNPFYAAYKWMGLDTKYGFGSHGAPGKDRDIFIRQNIIYRAKNKGINVESTPSGSLSQLWYGQAGLKDAISLNDNNHPYRFDFRGDRINIIDYRKANVNISKDFVYEKGPYKDINLQGKNDLIEFYFSSVVLKGTKYRPAEVIVFRATFDNIIDNHKPTWTPHKYLGRGDPLYSYNGYEREIQFGFTVHVDSADAMKATWRKLNFLASWTAPEYTKAGFMRAPLIRLNIGNLYRKFPGYINSLSYTIDNQLTNWETAEDWVRAGVKGGIYKKPTSEDETLSGSMWWDARGHSFFSGEKGKRQERAQVLTSPGVLELPKTVKIQCSFVPVGVYRPEYQGVMYSLYDDVVGVGKLETGLIPSADDRTNYFRTFDDIPTLDPMNQMKLKIPVGEELVIPKPDKVAPENAGNVRGESV